MNGENRFSSFSVVAVLVLATVLMLPVSGAKGSDVASWREYAGRGYVIRHPADWRVSETEDNRILIESALGRYLLTTVMLPGVRADNLSPHMVQNCTGTRIDIRKFQAVNPFSMQASEQRGDAYETSAIMVQPASNGLTMMCATVVSSPSRFEAFTKVAAEVVASMKPANAQQARATSASPRGKTDWRTVSMRSRRDPEEGSYTVNIPEGWSFQGGTGRVHVLETRQWFIASSPDGEITIIYGDIDVPRFVERDPMGMLPQGQWYTTQFSGNFFIWPYQHGLEFARERAQNLFGTYSGFKLDQEHQMDMTQVVRDAHLRSASALAQSVTSGLSAFTFRHEGRALSGAYWATTARYADSGGWGLVQAVRIVSSAERVEEALSLAMKMMPVLDPQWQQQQMAGAMRNQRIMTDSFDQTSRMIRESYESRVAASERGTRDFVDGIWGTQRLQDPATGQRYEMQHGSLSYWLHDGGTVVGVETHQNPHPSHFRELLQIRN